MASLQKFLEKSKSLSHKVNGALDSNIYIAIIIIMVALASFGLGRLSKMEELKTPIKIIGETNLENQASVTNTLNNKEIKNSMGESSLAKQYVASKSGTKYHLPWCSGAVNIKEENKIWFDSKKEAEKAGYSPASNCKGI